jgi:ABC-type multidrug transport system fused ATPase/permease subunit
MAAVADPFVAAQHAVIRRGARLIGRSLRAHPIPHTIAIFGANLYALAVVGWTIVLGRVTDRVIVPAFEEGRPGRATVLGALLAIMTVGVIRSIGTVLRRFFLAIAQYRTQRTWRRELLDHYLDVPLAFYQQHATGELLATADNDIETSCYVLRPLAYSLGVIMLGVYALISLAIVHPLLVVIALVLFPSLALINHVYTRKVEVPAATVQERIGEVSGIAHESFDGIMAVKTLGIETGEVERLRAASQRLRESRLTVGGYRASFEPAIDALPELGMISLLALGSWLVSRDVLTIGQLIQATALFSMLAVPMRIVGYFLEEMPRSVVARDRVDNVLADRDTPTHAITAPAPHHGLPDGGLGVEADGVAFAYGDFAVLQRVDLSLQPGESVALVGSTGSGKSTLALLLAGLVPPTDGTVRVGHVDLRTVEDDQRAHAIAMVFQESMLFADTLRENITLGRPLDDSELRRLTDLVRATDFIDVMPHGVDTEVGERGVTLSGGQRQRVALARALAGRPRVLILDDATSAVDPVIEQQILANLRKEHDLTLIVVAYRLATIRLADRVVYLSDGRIVAEGSHEELLRRPDYEALVRAYELAGQAVDHD